MNLCAVPSIDLLAVKMCHFYGQRYTVSTSWRETEIRVGCEIPICNSIGVIDAHNIDYLTKEVLIGPLRILLNVRSKFPKIGRLVSG